MNTYILLAEDNPVNQTVIRSYLNSLGYEIDVVSDGHGAVRACSEGRYDVVLMDYQMPGLNGTAAARQIRTLNIEQPAIIALTARSVTGYRQECLKSGMDYFLSKPFRAPVLIQTIKKALEARARL